MASVFAKSIFPLTSASRIIIRTTALRTSSCFTRPISNPLIHKMPLVTINQSLRESLRKHEIIPDVVDDFTPNTMLSIAFLTNKEVSLGNTLKPEDAQEQPILQITPESEDESKTYTIVLTDPDAPSRKDTKWSEFCHWIVTDVKLPSLEAITASATAESMSIDFSRSRELVKYMGPAPPEKTGKHRYVFLLYRNPSSGGKLEGPSERKRWGNDEPRKGVRQWAEKYGLELVGANFFFAQDSRQ